MKIILAVLLFVAVAYAQIPMDTPAVHYAKMDHFARYNYEAARNTYGAYGLYNGLYHPMAGVYQPDTLEVTLAKMDHFRAKDEALARLG